MGSKLIVPMAEETGGIVVMKAENNCLISWNETDMPHETPHWPSGTASFDILATSVLSVDTTLLQRPLVSLDIKQNHFYV
jgi:hypothetical protein